MTPGDRGEHGRWRTAAPRRSAVGGGLAVVAAAISVLVLQPPAAPAGRSAAAAHARAGGTVGRLLAATRRSAGLGTAGGARAASSTRGARGARGGGTSGTFLGAYGVESRAVVAENRRAGTTAWRISGTPASGFIEGFADTTYASAGQTVHLYVSTTAPSFKVVAYRMGYYRGKGARRVWSSRATPGRVQPACPVTPGVNMVSCDDWSRSLSVRVTASFVQGDYLLKLVGSGGQQSYVLLTVWDPASRAAYLVMSRSMTEEGWNTFGGYDFYQGEGPCTLGQTGSYPPCNRARVVSFDRPFATGHGASDFLANEYPLVRFMEEHGLDVAYCTDVTVDAHPTMLLRHRVLVSLDHDETWTYPELRAAQHALAHGVNIAFLSAAAIVRHARLEPSPLGPDREEVDYRNPTEDPTRGTGPATTVTGNTFATPPAGILVTSFVGGEYSGFLDPGKTVPLVVTQATAWLYRGTGLHDGSTVPGVVGSDINHVNPAASPPGLEVLAHSPVPLSEAYTNQGTWGQDTYADTTYYTDPASKAGVFQGGTTIWVNALDPCVTSGGSCPNAPLAKITGNLLRAFGRGPAGKLEPSVPNLGVVTPPGS